MGISGGTDGGGGSGAGSRVDGSGAVVRPFGGGGGAGEFVRCRGTGTPLGGVSASESCARRGGDGRALVSASSSASTRSVGPVGRSSSAIGALPSCTSVAPSSSSKLGAERAPPPSLSDCGCVVRRPLSRCDGDAGTSALGISCAGRPSSVPVGATTGGRVTVTISLSPMRGLTGSAGNDAGRAGSPGNEDGLTSASGLSVASTGEALGVGPFGGLGLSLSAGSVFGGTVAAKASGVRVGAGGGAEVVIARGPGRGSAGRGGGAADLGATGGFVTWRDAGSRLPQCTHSRASSGFSCAQKGQNRIPSEES